MGVKTACNYFGVFVSLTFHREIHTLLPTHSGVCAFSEIKLNPFLFLSLLLLLTSTQLPSESYAGEVVTLAVFSIHKPKAGWVARTLATEALTLPTAHLCTIVGPVQGCTHCITYHQVNVCGKFTNTHWWCLEWTLFSPAVMDLTFVFFALTPRTYEPRVTYTGATFQSPLSFTAVCAVQLSDLLAITHTERLQLHLQSVLEAHWPQGEMVWSIQTAVQLHRHVKGHLGEEYFPSLSQRLLFLKFIYK